MGEPLVNADRVMVETYSGGTGDLVLGSVAAGYLHPGSQIQDGARSTWLCRAGATWELFQGIYTAGSPGKVSRAAPIWNSNEQPAFINWPADTLKLLSQVPSAKYLPGLDTDGLLLEPQLPDALMSEVIMTSGVPIPNDTEATLGFASLGVNALGVIGAPVQGKYLSATIQRNGKYGIEFGASFAANATGQRRISILVNGNILRAVRASAAGTGDVELHCFRELNLGAGDAIEFRAYQNSGGTLVVGGNNWSSASITRRH